MDAFGSQLFKIRVYHVSSPDIINQGEGFLINDPIGASVAVLQLKISVV